MGEVWKALDTQLGRHVAIKLLRTDMQDNPEFAIRFEQEARFIAALRHPNIVHIHDFSISQPPESEIPTAYIVMDYIQGQTLGEYIRNTSRKRLFPPAADIVSLFASISRALDYAHSEGKIHRDIKPANILLDKRHSVAKPMGEPTLIDFGIARLQGVASGTAVGSLLGTPLYISPEQAQGLHSDHRSDLYSLGVILYEIMTGTTPFRGETTVAILMQHLSEMPTSPSLINPNISPQLSAVILKSLAKKPEDRFQGAAAMTIALAEALNVPIPRNLLPSGLTHDSPTPMTPLSPLHLTPAHSSIGSSNPYQPLVNTQEGGAPLIAQPVMQGQGSLSMQAPLQQVSRGGESGSGLHQFWKRYRSIIIAVLLLVVLLSSGLAVPALFPQNTPATDTPVGKLTFTRNSQGIYDHIQIELQNVPPPPEGRVYYAWVESLTIEGSPPKIQLTVHNGTIQATLEYAKNSHINDAFFLITAEDKSSLPVIPYTDLRQRFYYANIADNTTEFAIRRCPKNLSSTICAK
jgi:serine/threonine protein kinase